MSSQTVTLDVREEIRKGGEPFSKIMSAVAQLRPDENLLLLAPFEPKPLFGVLAKQGFNHTAREIENGDWEVLFTRSGEKPDVAIATAPVQRAVREVETKGGRWLEVDARGLEPPQPLVTILEALADLPVGAAIARPYGPPPDAPLRRSWKNAGSLVNPRNKLMEALSPKSTVVELNPVARKPVRPAATPSLAGLRAASVRLPLCFVVAGRVVVAGQRRISPGAAGFAGDVSLHAAPHRDHASVRARFHLLHRHGRDVSARCQ